MREPTQSAHGPSFASRIGRSRRLQALAFPLTCFVLVGTVLADWQAHGGGSRVWQPTTLGWALLIGALAVVLGVVVLTLLCRPRPLLVGAVVVLVVAAAGLHLLLVLDADRRVSSLTYGRSPDGRQSLVATRYAGCGQDYATVYVVRDFWHLVQRQRAVEWTEDDYVPSSARWIDNRTVSVDGDRVDIDVSHPRIADGP